MRDTGVLSINGRGRVPQERACPDKGHASLSLTIDKEQKEISVWEGGYYQRRESPSCKAVFNSTGKENLWYTLVKVTD